MRPRAASLKVEATMRQTSRANAVRPRKGYSQRDRLHIPQRSKGARGRGEGRAVGGCIARSQGNFHSPDTPRKLIFSKLRYFNLGQIEEIVKNRWLKMAAKPHEYRLFGHVENARF